MSIRQKVQEVEEAFFLLSQEMGAFQGWSGLSCKAGCGKCCTKADIEATVLEFLPFAYHVFRLGEAEEWLKRLEEHPDTICLFFKPNQLGSGLCSQYQHRGLICRLFGFSGRTNKYAQREFVTCQTVKTEQSHNYQRAVERVRDGEFIPVMNHHYMRLVAIDPQLARDFYPINKAIKLAIETVLHYYAYRDASE